MSAEGKRGIKEGQGERNQNVLNTYMKLSKIKSYSFLKIDKNAEKKREKKSARYTIVFGCIDSRHLSDISQ